MEYGIWNYTLVGCEWNLVNLKGHEENRKQFLALCKRLLLIEKSGRKEMLDILPCLFIACYANDKES